VTATDLLGRDRELAELRRHGDAARAGRGRVVLVAGEAGAGKTALASAFAESSGLRTAWGSCHEESAGYEPWVPVLRALGRPLPALTGAAGTRFQLFDEVVDVVTGAGPVLIVLDDLHWADDSSLQLLHAVAAGIADAPVLVIGLHRPTPLLRTVARERVASEMPLRGLDPDAVAALAVRTAGHPLPASVTRDLWERSGGNPLFVRALTGLDSGTVPDSIRAVIGSRLARLPGAVQDTLRTAAVRGREFSPDGLDPDALDAAVDAGVLRADGRALRFDHVLLQEVLYAQLPAARRRELHVAAAAATTDLDLRAHHLRSAGALIDVAQARDATLAAARQARGQLAFEHAAAQFRAALELGPDDPALLLELAAAEYRAGAVERAWEACSAAADHGRARGDAAVMADAATLLRGITQSSVTPRIHALCRETLPLLDPADAVRTARVLAQLAVTADRFDPAAEPDLGERALAVAERAGDRTALAMALQARHSELLNVAHVRDRLALGARAIELDDESRCWGHSWRLDAFTELGDEAGAAAELAALSALVEHRREPWWLWRLGMIRACRAMTAGRFADAREYATAALATGRRGGNDAAEFFEITFAAELAELTGDGLTEAEAAVRRVTAGMPFIARGWLARVLLARGRRDEAAAIWAGLVPLLEAIPPPVLEWLVGTVGNAVLATSLDDSEAGKVLYGQLLPYADRFVGAAAHAPNQGPVSLFLGMLAALGADPGRAEEHLGDALAATRATGALPREAMTRVELARFRRRRRGPGDARIAEGHLEAARRIADRIGMRPLAARITAMRAAPALSAREDQVAALVAEGLSNRQIAGRLGLSERTAENHVTHILTKLGLDSRAAVAAWHTARARTD
jgi:DNA-binding CsgD family transcriptional regulator